MQAVLDTSVLYADLTMAGPLSRLLLDRARRGGYTLIVPEVVLIEMVNHARRRIEEAVQKIHRGESSLSKLGVATARSAVEVEPMVRMFAGRAEAEITAAGGIVAEIPVAEHRDLVLRSARGIKPFTRVPQDQEQRGKKLKSDKGYRDTLIWLTVVEAAKEGPVTFVTSNADDFSDGHGGLHADLRSELEQLELLDRVHVTWSLQAFLEENVPPDEHGLEAFQRKLAGDEAFRAALDEELQRIVGAYDEWGGFVDVDFVGLREDRLRGEHRPEAIYVYAYDILDVAATNAYEFGPDDGEGVIELEVKAEVSAELLFHKGDAEWLIELGSDVTIDDWDYNETMVSASTTVYVTVRLHLLFDRSSGQRDEPTVVEVSSLPADDPLHP